MSYVLTSLSGNLISAASAGYAPTNSAEVSAIASAYATGGGVDSATVSAIASAYVESGVSSKQDTLTFGYNDSTISSINGSALAGGGGVDSATVSAIASAYVESGVSGKQDTITYGYNSGKISSIDGSGIYIPKQTQVVTSLQYATSESAIVATTVTADTAVGYGARYISAEYYDYGYSPWTDYDSSKPLIKVRMTAMGNMANYSSNPYYLYVVPYGATNNGYNSTTSQLTDALAYGAFSGGMNDFIIAEGTGSAYSQDPNYVEVTFDVTHVPFVGSEPVFWGTVEGHYAVVDSDEYSRPVFCVAGGNYGAELFEVRGNTTASLDFGAMVTVSSVSGINHLDIYTTGGGGIDSATVSAIASSYAEDVSAAASGAVSAVSSNSADWMKLSSCFAGLSGIVTSVGSSTLFTPATASSFMGIGSAIKSTIGSGGGFVPNVKYTMGLSGYYPSVKLSAHEAQTYVQYMDDVGSISTIYVGPTALITGVSGDISAYSTYGAFTLDYTANSIEPLAFQSDLPTYSYDSNSAISAINGSSLAGSTYSAGEGIDITDDVISVEAPVDVVAGPGITIDNPDGNTMRISCDSAYATVLYSGANVTSATLSDNVMNYEFVDFYLSDDTNQTLYLRMDTTRDPLRVGGWGGFGGVLNTSSNWFGIRFGVVSASANSAYSLPTDQMSIFMSGGFRYSGQSTYYSIFKVYGINRTASAQ